MTLRLSPFWKLGIWEQRDFFFVEDSANFRCYAIDILIGLIGIIVRRRI